MSWRLSQTWSGSRTTKVWVEPLTGWSHLVSIIGCGTREVVAGIWVCALGSAVLKLLLQGPRGLGLTLTTDNLMQCTYARYVEALNGFGRTAYNHPEGNSYIERLHRSLKEEEVWIKEYQSFDLALRLIASWIEEHNHDRPHCGLRGPNASRIPCLLPSHNT